MFQGSNASICSTVCTAGSSAHRQRKYAKGSSLLAGLFERGYTCERWREPLTVSEKSQLDLLCMAVHTAATGSSPDLFAPVSARPPS